MYFQKNIKSKLDDIPSKFYINLNTLIVCIIKFINIEINNKLKSDF